MKTFQTKIMDFVPGILIFVICMNKCSANNVFECLESENKFECKISANITKENTSFTIKTNLAKKSVTWFYFVDPSFVPVLPSDVCDTFPKLQSFNGASVSLEEILPYAFKNCSELKYLNLENNPIQKLPETTFVGLSKLTHLYISDVGLVEISERLFHDLGVLKVLSLTSSKIESLPAKVFEGLVNLKTLVIYSN